MTGRVAQGLRLKKFATPERLERLTCHFAMRYISAADSYQRGRPPPRCWRVAFDAADRWRPVVLQHLLLGINAHINYDLGIAVAEVAENEEDLAALRGDFDDINAVLAELLDDVQGRLASVSPWMGILDWFGGPADEAIVNFSLRHARRAAWDVAVQLTPLPPLQRAAVEAELDSRIARFGSRIASPGFLLQLGMIPVRLRERRSVESVIGALMRPTVNAS